MTETGNRHFFWTPEIKHIRLLNRYSFQNVIFTIMNRYTNPTLKKKHELKVEDPLNISSIIQPLIVRNNWLRQYLQKWSSLSGDNKFLSTDSPQEILPHNHFTLQNFT